MQMVKTNSVRSKVVTAAVWHLAMAFLSNVAGSSRHRASMAEIV